MDTSIPRIPPPVYFLLSLIAMLLLNAYWPIAYWLHAPWKYLGILMLITGFALSAGSALLFRKSGTHLRPGARATFIVVKGPFRYTRNPMYAGLLIMLMGTAILLGTVSPLLILPLFFIILHTQFVLKEEKWMEQWFGDAYLKYKNSTPRWFM
ncbi:isoprenylcysteine carboxylmethyltransferase family protein [Niabella pedocola]|uniref:Isoprenylcysteine carboxylmethyltransferase family protein n=1 Tax=Niabella pedocola TaxID=1752077 RepID=A0ABS8PUL6_9BACT|nr:isoprenylcysteine carboxylmethyltransferase family protein [Niabella pedocola]MCD2424770.1 isoprenylcysteine carboxylmethyltransferase family protein [Niabella pedocola]